MRRNPPAAEAGTSLDEVPWPKDAVEVARILGAWGVAGGLKIKAYATDPQALFSSKRWHLLPPEATAVGLAADRVEPRFPRLLKVVQAREQGDSVVATVQEVADRDAAQALKGARIFIPRGSFPSLEADEFYWVDLIGLEVINRELQVLGNVVGLLETGPHCVLQIQCTGSVAPNKTECLVPFVNAYIDGVDLVERRIRVDWALDD